jgi:peptidoglycan/xylan/chitin deacetylase (PgdA/CDA1 family)
LTSLWLASGKAKEAKVKRGREFDFPMRIIFQIVLLISSIALNAQYPISTDSVNTSNFRWPGGKQMAISLTFDDARPTQIDNGIAILNRYGIKATFYVTPDRIPERLEGWKSAVKGGHEIGNHTLNHPCSGNFPWARSKALENFRLRDIASEMKGANRAIQEMLGVQPETFAYPCGQTFVGRGKALKSYIPLVHKMFLAGRGWLNEGPNDPAFCDLSNLFGIESDGKLFEDILPVIREAGENGSWVIFAGHEIGSRNNQTTLESTLEEICAYASNPENNIWIAPVKTIAKYIQEHSDENGRKSK